MPLTAKATQVGMDISHAAQQKNAEDKECKQYLWNAKTASKHF